MYPAQSDCTVCVQMPCENVRNFPTKLPGYKFLPFFCAGPETNNQASCEFSSLTQPTTTAQLENTEQPTHLREW
jgi:hypothetical protein